MRPQNQLRSILLHTWTTIDGKYIPQRIELNLWIALQLTKRGGDAKDSKTFGSHSITSAYKAQILEFWVAQGSTSIFEIKV